MDHQSTVENEQNDYSNSNGTNSSTVLDIYPLSCYYFGSKDAVPLRNETVEDRVLRLKAKYDAYGMRTCVAAVIVELRRGAPGDEGPTDGAKETEASGGATVGSVSIFGKLEAWGGVPGGNNLTSGRLGPMVAEKLQRSNPRVELLRPPPELAVLQVEQQRQILVNSIYKLPGGRARFGESDIDCLKRKLLSKLCVGEESRGPEWEVGECLGMWWRPDFETLLYPCLPANIKRPKECTKLFLIKLPASRRFTVPKNFKLLAVPLCQIHDNEKIYGPIISGVPQLLSKLSFNIVEP
ncbi:Pre-mRNA cleavage factor Im 25 kDa subunit 1 [Forsythia ovata]|uniref:Pre-mRNA cleavage factor Im 25 kDa subunit n=1 Tax=Forsythia ovata TaxID=205694 RepID=A0ABD1WGK6_9LAMI